MLYEVITRDDHQGHGQHHPHQPRHDVVLGNGLGIETRVDDRHERCLGPAQITELPRQVAVQGAFSQNPEGRQGMAGGRRVGGVGAQEQGGAFAAQQAAAELFRDAENELNLSYNFV